MDYLIYDREELVAGFVYLVTAVAFTEEWYYDSTNEVDLVDARAGKIIDTWINGAWENGKF